MVNEGMIGEKLTKITILSDHWFGELDRVVMASLSAVVDVSLMGVRTKIYTPLLQLHPDAAIF